MYSRTPYRRRRFTTRRASLRRAARTSLPRKGWKTRRRVSYLTRRRRPVGRKALLNVTSRKKQDNMVSWTQEGISTAATGFQPNPPVFTGNQGTQVVIWRATQRERLTAIGGTDTAVDDVATRTSTSCYMRGLKERIRLVTNGSEQWIWRRICFTFKGNDFNNLPQDVDFVGVSSVFSNLTSAGYTRAVPLVNFTDIYNQNIYNRILAYIFKGTQAADWRDVYQAKTDNSRVNIKYDRTIRLASGNDSGTERVYSLWHPMNKTLIYDEDEVGGRQGEGSLSAMHKQSMGDYYVMDFITCANSNTDQTLVFDPQATLYWHER